MHLNKLFFKSIIFVRRSIQFLILDFWIVIFSSNKEMVKLNTDDACTKNNMDGCEGVIRDSMDNRLIVSLNL